MSDWASGTASTGSDTRSRCAWATARERDEALLAYHDHEWGTPGGSERAVFEALTLGIFQAGLGWLTVFHKRAAFRAAFHDFDPARVAQMDDADVAVLLEDPGIIRNEAKIRSALRNAAVMATSEFALADLANDAGPREHQRPSPGAAVPSHTPESEALSRRLKAEGYVFIGPTSAYAFMQAIGVVNDHVVGCFRGDELER
ncbi:DNA-3-methyladenine glycosylase I [Agromyces sp. 3263]|uniref:DNA-3-methyladenine glycosylase I n=1 Tax=Agromyces sp. 3263 TaxID=2817750 RepID=UPI002858D79F|nr:DNA-3-methyladenine glycosylase I [Agromyces sp. 3263]MDR6907952.1 DNA-3-methyladenine glycosylase I [Agromyces sp. 3263]